MKNQNIVVVDYQLSNLFSIVQACRYLNIPIKLSGKKADIMAADALILPGVGSFGDAMQNLHRLDLVQPLLDKVAQGTPLLGVCLGLQLLFEESEEFGRHRGLGLLEGAVRKFPKQVNGQNIKIPHIGWNEIQKPQSATRWAKTPLAKNKTGDCMYFIHSFCAQPENAQDICAISHYSGVDFCAAVQKNNLFATQFHPEKSGKEGIQIYRQWYENCVLAGVQQVPLAQK